MSFTYRQLKEAHIKTSIGASLPEIIAHPADRQKIKDWYIELFPIEYFNGRARQTTTAWRNEVEASGNPLFIERVKNAEIELASQYRDDFIQAVNNGQKIMFHGTEIQFDLERGKIGKIIFQSVKGRRAINFVEVPQELPIFPPPLLESIPEIVEVEI